MNAKILDSIPVSGSYPEYHFGDHFRDKLWVEFENNTNDKWVGCFAHQPYKAFDKVICNDKCTLALVVSGGSGYFIDIEKRSLIYQAKDYPPIESAICTSNPEYFLVGTFDSILVLDRTGLIKEIVPEFSLYGIYFTEQLGGKAIGDISSYLYGDINVGFELDLSNFEISIDKTVAVKRWGPVEYVTVSESKTRPLGLLSKIWRYLSD